jgi:hypothetical protein
VAGSRPTSAKKTPIPGAVKRASFPLIVTVAVPSPFDWTIIGPPRAEFTDFPLSGFVHVM